MGIDPGTTVMGFGIIKVINKQMHFVQMNELMLRKYDDPYTKLKLIFERTIELIDTYHPDEIAIEAPFYGKNVQSMLKLGRAQGVAMAAGLSREIPITEYMPKKIKMAIHHHLVVDYYISKQHLIHDKHKMVQYPSNYTRKSLYL